MSLDLNIAKLAGPGRLPVAVELEYVRDLTEADIALLATKPAESKAPELKRLTDRHHALARLLAAGTTESDASIILGYSNSRISILKNSPAFQELLEFYRTEADTKFASVLDFMAGLSRDALQELSDRMEETPERFSNQELMKMGTDFTDRTAARDNLPAKAPTVIELVAPAPPEEATEQGEGLE